jgi:hypothetical protein
MSLPKLTLHTSQQAVGIILIGSFGTWFIFARRTFQGPLQHVIEEGIVPVSELEPTVTKDKKEGVDGLMAVKSA